MEISRRRSLSLDLDTFVVSPAASSYPPTYGNCGNMYAMTSSPETRNEKPYRMVSSLSVDSATKSISEARKESFFTSMFGALTSIVVERLGKVPSAFMSNLHNSLSVTVVPNETIISQEFFKNLTRSCEQLTTEHTKDPIENLRISDEFQNKNMYDIKSPMSYLFSDDTRKIPLSSKVSLNLECNITNERDRNQNNGEATKLSKSPLISTEIFNELDVRIPLGDWQEAKPESCSKAALELRDEGMESETFPELPTRPSASSKCLTTADKMNPSMSTAQKTKESEEMSKMGDERYCNRWQAMWEKVVNGMSERFSSPRAVSPDSEVPTKKPNLLKPSRRKTCTVARGRGKGRGKSQLRRNGVSQSRHRKERTKQIIHSDIQEDLDDWENEERYEGSEDDDSSANERSIDQIDSSACDPLDQPHSTLSRHCSTLFENLSFDVMPQARKRKQNLRNSTSNCPMRVRYVPESSMEVENHDSSYNSDDNCSSRLREFRPRLVSESSVDSEDSYCIVFENGSESEYSDDDYDDGSDSESEVTSDDDFDDHGKRTMTVRFNPKPQVHTMVKWDYAYRAARRGPWEEMARDRERFRGRIHCIERILTPILSDQHRDRIWQNRFDVDE